MRSYYDNKNALFTPSGRILQVEYADESVLMGMPIVGVRALNGIVLAALNRPRSRTEDNQFRKLRKISDNIVCGFAGNMADMELVYRHARQEALRHRLVHRRDITCSKLTRRVAELHHGYTADQRLRPLAAMSLWVGYDLEEGLQLIETGPAGYTRKWKARCGGGGRSAGMNELNASYSEEMVWQTACALAYRALKATSVLEDREFKLENIEIAVLRTVEDGGFEIHFLDSKEIEETLNETERIKNDTERSDTEGNGIEGNDMEKNG